MFHFDVRRLKLHWIVLFILLSIGAGWAREVRPPHACLGMNLNGPADWNSELPLVDVFRFSRQWISQQQGADWGQGPDLDLDKHGRVRRLKPGCWAETLMCTIEGGHYPMPITRPGLRLGAICTVPSLQWVDGASGAVGA